MKLQAALSLDRNAFKIAFAVLLLAGASSPSWAWGRGGYRGGGGFGVVVAPYWGPADPYYYSPYYYPPYAYPYAAPPPNYAPYAPAAAAPQAAEPVPDVPAYDLKTLEEQVAKARNSVNFQYSDGDISKEQLQRAGLNIDLVEKQARAEAAAAGGYLTRAQQDALLRALWTGQPPAAESLASAQPPAPTQPPAPVPTAPEVPPSTSAGPAAAGSAPGENLTLVTDQLVRLRRLLDGKLAHGDVTKAQYDGESNYLAQFEKMVRAQASGNGNDLTPEQENTLLMQLLRIQKSIQRNFIAD